MLPVPPPAASRVRIRFIGPARRVVAGLLSLLTALLATGFTTSCVSLARDDEREERAELFFETQVRPLLMERCSGCHGPSEQSGGLRVDLRAALLGGGERGAAIEPGQPSRSLLLQAVRREPGLEMPPDDRLAVEQIEVLEKWIADGAYWPNREEPLRMVDLSDAASHWAFQSPGHVALPALVEPKAWIRTPVDAFVLDKLQANGLEPALPADRRTLIRRATFALTGLPPSEAAVEDFIRDDRPNAYETLVEQLLASKEYGQHWGRRWLDVARYADTKGYVYAREERFWVHAWTYRDWVINALNEDMPYDRFLLLQLAADQVAERRDDLAAMGLLTLGRRFLGVERDIIDDRIDVVTRGALGLTVACARCHDHKYDPIPTEDYYSLYGVFASCMERLEPLVEGWEDAEFAAELQKRQTALDERLQAARSEASQRARQRLADYLLAQAELHKYPPAGFDQIFSANDLLPSVVHRWEAYLRHTEARQDRIFAIWRSYMALAGPRTSPAEFAVRAAAWTEELQASGKVHHPSILAAFATPPRSLREVAERYGAVLADIDRQWQAYGMAAEQSGLPKPKGLEDTAAEELRQVLYGIDSPCMVPVGPVVSTEAFFDTETINQLWKLQVEVDRWILNAQRPAPHALTLTDAEVPVEPRVFLRGNPAMQGDNVPRRFLEVLSDAQDRSDFKRGSGRLELAQKIIDPGNPLTARVIVNRIWTSYFGTGLVATPSDFGLRAAPPSHPELLDWLAVSFIEHGWSIKQLHRWIALSSTFRQSSLPSDSSCASKASQLDPGNRLLWKMNARRLGFEEFRDALLAVGGDLDTACGGRPNDLFKPPYDPRRTIYGLVDRQFLPATLRVFDFANPDLHVPSRNETTVPDQALFFLNHPWMLERARQFAASFAHVHEPGERVERMLRRIFQREPLASEVTQALAFLDGVEASEQPASPPTAADWAYGFGSLNVDDGRVDGFQRLPHFTGEAWQGGTNYPDATLGWVQLTAHGGHPGNDSMHASVRRWTSPERLTVRVCSHLVHEREPGDGIRAAVVHSRLGLLAMTSLHQDKRDIDIECVELQQGEWLDFVVDIGQVLNSDEYGWRINIAPAMAGGKHWDSVADFTSNERQQLNAWEQLAQILMCSNEFLFVD
jgi:hypothetical protein